MARARARSERSAARRSGRRETLSFVGWHLLMLVWLTSWVLGAWWVWPVLARLELDGETLSAAFWLVTGGLAWVAALLLGYGRYWARRSP